MVLKCRRSRFVSVTLLFYIMRRKLTFIWNSWRTINSNTNLMKHITAFTISLVILCLASPGYSQETNLCVGNYWTEDEAKVMMSGFADQWTDKSSWEKRANQIRSGHHRRYETSYDAENLGKF